MDKLLKLQRIVKGLKIKKTKYLFFLGNTTDLTATKNQHTVLVLAQFTAPPVMETLRVLWCFLALENLGVISRCV